MNNMKIAVQLELPNIELEQPKTSVSETKLNYSNEGSLFSPFERDENQLELPFIDTVDEDSSNKFLAGNAGGDGIPIEWQCPRPLIEDDLPPALKLRDEMLPKSIRAFVREKAFSIDDMSPDYLAVSLITMLASIIGSNVEIEPKKNDTWRVVCILWALLVGKASEKKTPAMSAAVSFVDKVKKEVIAPIGKRNSAINAVKKKRFDIARRELEQELEVALEQGNETALLNIAEQLADLIEPPIFDQKEVYINDSTIEALTICAQT